MKEFNQNALKQSNDRLNALISATTDVVYRTNPDWSVMYNLKSGDFLSSVEIPIDDWLYKFIPSDSQQEVLAAINRAIGTKSKFELEYQVLRADGSTGWTFSSAIPILDDKGVIVEWLGIAHDITDRKTTEFRLQHSEERFYKTFRNIPVPATIIRFSDNILTDVNQIFLQQFEYSRDEVINHSSLELNLFTDHNEWMKSIEILESDGYVRDYELEMLKRTGKKLTFLVSSETIIIQEQKHCLTTYINITEQKEITRNQQILAAIVQYAEVPIISKNIKGNILTWNKGAEKIYGYTAEEVIGKNVSILVPEGEKNEIPELIKKVLQGETIVNYETRRRRKDGIVIPVSINLSLIKSDLVEIIGISNISYDLSEIKIAEERLKNYGIYLEELVKNRTAELEAAKNKAETIAEDLLRSNKELQQFAYLTSHDLQEPLRTISTFTQFLSERYKDKFDADGQQFIHYIVENSLRMKALLHDLLIYSRAGTKALKFNSVDFNNIFDKVVYKYRLSIEEKNAEVTSDELPTVMGDEAQLQQLMLDLVWNSLKFCDTTPKIHISAKEEPGNYLFSVKDNGIGIEPQYADRIFLIFQRLANRHEYGGNGMGLAVCKRIVERHGGKIWFESQWGEGTTFYFTIAKNQV